MRELNQGSALFLLYGESGVGKTRLLQELGQSRLADRPIYWLDLNSDDGSEETRLDRSDEVEALFAAAVAGDIIIADHFEMALKKTRHQLFLSWSTDGIDKNLNLIIASNKEGFNELRQLSQQYGVRVQSFEQMPFNADEIQAFLGFYLFPDQPLGKLTIPSPLRKQIASSQGIVGRLIEIADRDGAQIKSAPAAEAETIRQGSRVVVYVLLLLVLMAGGGWYMLSGPAQIEAPPITLNLPANEAPDTAPGPTVTVDESVEKPVVAGVDEPGQAGSPETVVDTVVQEPVFDAAPAEEGGSEAEVGVTQTQEPVAFATDPEQQPAPTQPAEITAAPGGSTDTNNDEPLAPEPASGTSQAEVSPDTTTSLVETEELEPGVMPESEAVIAESVAGDSIKPATPTDSAPLLAQSSEQRFTNELQQSMDWISAREDKVGTIQILLLSYENFDADNYYEYVTHLAARDVDTGQLRVFKTLTGNREVYSVVYGEFASRKTALGEIGSLPEVLRKTAPLARSVGGLWQEIRRLESKN